MSPYSQSSIQPAAPDKSGASFGRSSDGLLVALVGENSYAMVPARGGQHYLATGWRISRPMAEWTRSDFYSHFGDLADEGAFRAKVLEQAQHCREKQALGRLRLAGGAHTPWGQSQGGTIYAEGVVSHSTAGHGGFKLSAERNRKVHTLLRAPGGWYEEDECWAIVAITFPQLFTSLERRYAEQTVKDSWPDAWEEISGTRKRRFSTSSPYWPPSSPVLWNASLHSAANMVTMSKSAASSCRRPNTVSGVSASSSIRIGMASMMAHRASPAGAGGRPDDSSARSRPAAFAP